MDLKEHFPDLSSFLLYQDGLKPIFFIIANSNLHGPSKLKRIAAEVLEHVRQIHTTGVRSSDPKYVDALLPVLLEALDSKNHEDQANALWALAILVKHGLLPGTPPSVVRFFKTNNEEILNKAVWVVQKYAHKELDITEYIPHIEPLLKHPVYWIRRMAADAIAEHEIRIGLADRIFLITNLYDKERLSTYWNVSVYHRRLHATDDTPIIQPKYVVHFTPERTCGACGFKNAYCIFYWDDSGTGWIDRISEYLCPECGKYTTYHYVD
ncbi:MAG: HEAT repeat domain-containing protein [Candidatus Thorarchaeota archaeon]|jgi:hypothetical protein